MAQAPCSAPGASITSLVFLHRLELAEKGSFDGEVTAGGPDDCLSGVGFNELQAVSKSVLLTDHGIDFHWA